MKTKKNIKTKRTTKNVKTGAPRVGRTGFIKLQTMIPVTAKANAVKFAKSMNITLGEAVATALKSLKVT
jgi:hypothetical protein